MSAQRCLSGGSPLPMTARFCPHCSQRSDTARLPFANMAYDLMHGFVNVERGPLVFAWALLPRPGVIAGEYVEGRRRHYGPFAKLVVLVGLTALVLSLLSFQTVTQEVSTTPAALLLQHCNLVLLVQLPLLGVDCALQLRDSRLRLFEHMVLVAH
jgi:hypothetical protein